MRPRPNHEPCPDAACGISQFAKPWTATVNISQKLMLSQDLMGVSVATLTLGSDQVIQHTLRCKPAVAGCLHHCDRQTQSFTTVDSGMRQGSNTWIPFGGHTVRVYSGRHQDEYKIRRCGTSNQLGQ